MARMRLQVDKDYVDPLIDALDTAIETYTSKLNGAASATYTARDREQMERSVTVCERLLNQIRWIRQKP